MLLRATRVRLARTPKTRPRRAARSPRRDTTSQTTTERKRSQCDEATTRRAPGPARASPARPGPSPRPRARQSARSRSQAGSSPSKETRRRRSALSANTLSTRALRGAHRPLPAPSSTRLARRNRHLAPLGGLQTRQKLLRARAARKATMRIRRARPSVLSQSLAFMPQILGDDCGRMERVVPRARRRSCRVSRVRSPFRARASAPLALRENTPRRNAPSSACPPSRAVLLLRKALLRRSRAPRVVTRAAQATRSALCVSLENTPRRSSRLSASVLNTRLLRGEPGATSPKKCEVGRYAPGEGSSSCTDANAGFFVADEAAKKQTPCPPGSYSATAASTCELCAAGTFSKKPGEASCTSCPAGSSSEAGSTRCAKCGRGTGEARWPWRVQAL